MSLNEAPSAVRTHIVFYGRTNVGKSSLVNRFTNQDLSIVSALEGTTTDPVRKAMELLPLGPVVVIDTPGLDDTTELGQARIKKAEEMLLLTDIAILVVDATIGLTKFDEELIAKFKAQNITFVVVYNKSDLISNLQEGNVYTNAVTGEGVNELREMVSKLVPQDKTAPLVSDLLNPGDTVILVIPIDSAAPKGRIILPQQMVIRDALEAGAMPLVCKETELDSALKALSNPPRLVITDSQAFNFVSSVVPSSIPLTSFSILMARMKGNLMSSVEGAKALDSVKSSDVILISEGCTHHRQCEDIGTHKIPNMIRKYTGENPAFEFTSGREFPDDLSKYKLVVHCGACTLTTRDAASRYSRAKSQNVPITNYGVLIAQTQGILDRSIEVFYR